MLHQAAIDHSCDAQLTENTGVVAERDFGEM